MAKSKGTITNQQLMAVLVIVGLAAGACALFELIIPEQFNKWLRPGGDATPTQGMQVPPVVEQTPPGTPVPAEPAGDALWAVYFTSPVIPFDGVTTGGVEENLTYLLNNAQSTIDGAMFELNLQNVADALIAAHQRGVRVRIVYDNEHTEDDPQMQQLIDAGISATPDERSAYMHNKFLVIDGEIVWTGSLNITINDAYKNNNNALAFVSRELAQNYTTEFEEMFSGQFGPTSPANTPYPGTQVGDIWVETYFAPEDEPLLQLLSVTAEAQHTIHFMAFSYTDYDLAKVMMDRADAGVEVVGIYESRGANTEASECPTLLEHGLDVRLDGNPATFHHKVVIIDGAIVATGSFNYSTNAATSNDENLLIIHSPQIAALYEEEFNRRMAEARLPVGGECLAGD
jgi:phosphatidylserine/phosphatidylglycerophosphate/cardiolipin synthase-like enzyme